MKDTGRFISEKFIIQSLSNISSALVGRFSGKKADPVSEKSTNPVNVKSISEAVVHQPQSSQPSPEITNGWCVTLSATAGSLLKLSATTETEFLSLGERLARINNSNRENASLADKVSEELVKNKTEELTFLGDQCDTCFKKANGAESFLDELSSELGLMIDNIQGIVHLNDHLDRTYRALRMVRVMIRVETENAGYTAFNTVSQALVTLEEQIAENAMQIHGISSETIDLINNIVTCFDNVKNNEKQFLKKDQNHVLELITEIHAGLSTIDNACSRMRGVTNAISDEISTVVINLQFHDNYRQRLEHISQTLHEVESQISAASWKNQENSELPKPWLLAVVDLQMAQLENLKAENGTVSGQLSASFDRIQALLQEQAETASEILPTVAGLAQQISDLQELTKRFYEFLGLYQTANADFLESSDKLLTQVSGIGELSSLIESVELNLRLLALNSMIKASSIGRRGRPLAVLSREINTISCTVQDQITERGSIISAIHKGSTHITTTLLTRIKGAVSEVDDIFEKTGASLKILLQQDESAGHTSEIIQKLQSDFSELMAQLQFNRIIDEALDHAMGELQKVRDDIDTCLPDPTDGSEEINLQELHSKYTMQSEREIHSEVTASCTAPESTGDEDSLSIELFSDEETDTAPLSVEEDLGDNIELF